MSDSIPISTLSHEFSHTFFFPLSTSSLTLQELSSFPPSGTLCCMESNAREPQCFGSENLLAVLKHMTKTEAVVSCSYMLQKRTSCEAKGPAILIPPSAETFDYQLCGTGSHLCGTRYPRHPAWLCPCMPLGGM